MATRILMRAGAFSVPDNATSVDRRLVMAYADPPYVGQSFKHYRDHPAYRGEVDHGHLIEWLIKDYPDGWALSASSPSLRELLPLCPSEARVMAWVKPFAAFKRNVRVAYAWEPVIVVPAPRLDGAAPTRDFVDDLRLIDLDAAVREPITMRRGFTGAKPDRFCWWLFEAMGLRPADELHDLFPGSGAVAKSWAKWRTRYSEAVPERLALDA
ncbi:MAG TPA: hypothetical protein VJT78_11445 [Candidatus Dormibacteraeota bacterium]|nr:hypothetical protein [Candidatus Dormibacteraeota bacterium]